MVLIEGEDPGDLPGWHPPQLGDDHLHDEAPAELEDRVFFLMK
jgi:hypothetical protein